MVLADIFRSYRLRPWYQTTLEYLDKRYLSIHSRYENTFRFVSPESDNAKSYSYEYASILRDIATVFDSTIKKILDETSGTQDRKIHGYLDYLRQFESNLNYISIQFLDNQHSLIYPFKPSDDGNPEWWKAYTSVKHFEIDGVQNGNFEYCTTALAGIFALRHGLTASNRTNNLFFAHAISPVQLNYTDDFFK